MQLPCDAVLSGCSQSGVFRTQCAVGLACGCLANTSYRTEQPFRYGLKMLEPGKRCIGATALRSNELTAALVRILELRPSLTKGKQLLRELT
jgi:hypothetical protein